jgi:hypothetical protein
MYAQKRPIENTHIIRERDRERFRELLAVLSLGLPVGLFLLLFTWQNLEVIRLGKEATRLQQIQQRTANENKQLRIELERLTSLDGIESKARELGFATTDPALLVNAFPAPADSGVR